MARFNNGRYVNYQNIIISNKFIKILVFQNLIVAPRVAPDSSFYRPSDVPQFEVALIPGTIPFAVIH
jgi:hypothetical protein